MKGLKIIPMFLVLIFFSFLGALFVERNPTPVAINFFRYTTPPTKLGLVVLCSMMLGMVIAGFLCSIEILALFIQNKNLRKKLNAFRPSQRSPYRPLENTISLNQGEMTSLSSQDDEGNTNTGGFSPK